MSILPCLFAFFLVFYAQGFSGVDSMQNDDKNSDTYDRRSLSWNLKHLSRLVATLALTKDATKVVTLPKSYSLRGGRNLADGPEVTLSLMVDTVYPKFVYVKALSSVSGKIYCALGTGSEAEPDMEEMLTSIHNNFVNANGYFILKGLEPGTQYTMHCFLESIQGVRMKTPLADTKTVFTTPLTFKLPLELKYKSQSMVSIKTMYHGSDQVYCSIYSGGKLKQTLRNGSDTNYEYKFTRLSPGSLFEIDCVAKSFRQEIFATSDKIMVRTKFSMNFLILMGISAIIFVVIIILVMVNCCLSPQTAPLSDHEEKEGLLSERTTPITDSNFVAPVSDRK